MPTNVPSSPPFAPPHWRRRVPPSRPRPHGVALRAQLRPGSRGDALHRRPARLRRRQRRARVSTTRRSPSPTCRWSPSGSAPPRSRPGRPLPSAHPDLLRWKPSVIDDYYSPARLWSDEARAQFVLPDRAPAAAMLTGAARILRSATTGSRHSAPVTPSRAPTAPARPLVPAALTLRAATPSSPDAAHRRPRCRPLALALSLTLPCRRRRRPDDRGRAPAAARPSGITEAWLASELGGLSAGPAGFSSMSPESWSIRDVVEHLAIAEPQYLEAGRGLDGQAAAGHALHRRKPTDAGILWYGIDRGNRQRTGEARVPDGRFKTAADAHASFVKLRTAMKAQARPRAARRTSAVVHSSTATWTSISGS